MLQHLNLSAMKLDILILIFIFLFPRLQDYKLTRQFDLFIISIISIISIIFYIA